MKFEKVKSSQIASIGHKGDTMHVTYASGHTYEFTGVTSEQHQALMAADSCGKHLGKMGIQGVKHTK